MRIEELKNKIIAGDAKEVLKEFPDESVDCVVTSPPYWALRDYGTGKWISGNPKCDHKKNPPAFSEKALAKSTIGPYANTGHSQENYLKICGKCGAKRIDKQLGLETTFQEYIVKLCDVFDEIKRVLKKEGTCWVNIGDTYYSISGGKFENDNLGSKDRNKAKGLSGANRLKHGKELAQKNLCNIPARFSIEMQNRGWILRNEIIWHKPNCMPSSVKDRFTVDFEKIYFFTKSHKYFFETQYEPYIKPMNRWGGDKLKADGESDWDRGTGQSTYRERNMRPNIQGRNKRCVWTINTHPFAGAHFATFPPGLIESPIKAGCPEFICKLCGKPKRKLFKKIEIGRSISGTKYNTENTTAGRLAQKRQAYRKMGFENMPAPKFVGYSDCGCGAGFKPGIILDPFIGSGTTAVIAQNLGLNFIGIELNSKYVEIAEKRLREISQKLL